MEQETTSKKPGLSLPAAIVTGAVIIAIALLVAFTPNTTSKKNPSATNGAPDQVTSIPSDIATVRPNDIVRGNPTTAVVTMIEYTDSDCYYCQQVHPTLKQVLNEYAGKVVWVYRYFPINSLHPNAYTEALALECAKELGGGDAFWKYLDTVIDVTLSPNPTSNKTLVTFATSQGIDSTLFQSCIADQKTAGPIDAGIAEAKTIGAQGTPFIVLVNKAGKQIVIPGAYPIEEFRTQIDALLK